MFVQVACGITAEKGKHFYEGDEAVQYKQEGSMQSMTPKEEQIRRRREQNRFRMRALRASESEVAQRLRERNKFRMRTLRASDSQVARSLRERNKYRMREIRSSESRLTCRLVEDTSLHAESTRGEECLPNDIKIQEHCLEQGQGVHITGMVDNSWRTGIRVDLVNVYTEGSKFPWVCVEKGSQQNKSFSVQGSEDVKQSAFEQSLNGVVHKAKSVPYECIPANRNNCKHNMYDRNEFHAAESEGKGSTKSEVGYMDGAVNCTQCAGFVVGSHEVGICAVSSSWQKHKNTCTVQMKSEESFEGQRSVTVGVEAQGDISQWKEKCSSHFVTFDGEITKQTKILIKDVPSEVREMTVPQIFDLAERRREKGKLRMRLKRHSETEEEAERRRERGRLRMRVLRASETEEQAARRRELNRLRMRMKRSSARH